MGVRKAAQHVENTLKSIPPSTHRGEEEGGGEIKNPRGFTRWKILKKGRDVAAR